MKKVQAILNRILHPPKWVLFLAPPVVFAVLAYVFITGQNNSAPAYPVYVASAYCLTILILPLPERIRSAKACIVLRINSTAFGGRYVNDLSFRGRRRIPETDERHYRRRRMGNGNTVCRMYAVPKYGNER